MAEEKLLSVELVFGTAREQVLLKVVVAEGSTIGDAIGASHIQGLFPDDDLTSLSVGIWGKPADRNRRVRDGDRIELYRPLQMDPRDARRKLAAVGKSMGPTDSGRK